MDMLIGSGWEIDFESSNCEIAIFNKEGTWVTQEIMKKFSKEFEDLRDDVVGYLSFEKWFELMKFIESL